MNINKKKYENGEIIFQKIYITIKIYNLFSGKYWISHIFVDTSGCECIINNCYYTQMQVIKQWTCNQNRKKNWNENNFKISLCDFALGCPTIH